VSQGRGTVQAGRNYRLKEEGESITDRSWAETLLSKIFTHYCTKASVFRPISDSLQSVLSFYSLGWDFTAT